MSHSAENDAPDYHALACPVCDAEPGERCRDVHGFEFPSGVHTSRVTLPLWERVIPPASTPAAMSHSAENDAAVRDALARLDGSEAAAVSLVTGLTAEELDDLGGLPTRVIPPGSGDTDD